MTGDLVVDTAQELPSPARVLEGLLGVPFTEGNRVQVLRNGDEAFPAILSAIAAARRSIDMLWFSWGHGEITARVADALAERARAGVRVRVLLDGFGARGIDRGELRELRSAGCEVSFRRPLRSPRLTTLNLRSHRRVLVCDETVAFTGGHGIDHAWTGDGDRPADWRDTGVLVEGPAVDGVRSGFALAWAQAQVHRPGALITPADRFPPQPPAGRTRVQVLRPASQPGWNAAALAISALLQVAHDRVRFCTPYARLPDWLVQDLVVTAGRGVQVQLLVSGPHVDRRMVHLQADRSVDRLLGGGVEVWRYQPSLIHAKVVTVDRELAMVGTTNLDIRSLALNEQLAVVLQDPDVVAQLDGDYDADLARSRQVSLDSWRSRPLRRRALEVAADLAGRPLLGWGAKGLSARHP